MKTIKVLLVDDDPGFLNRLNRYLDLQPRIQVLNQVNNGKQAINYVEANEVDLVLMDIQMDGINGVVATRKIKAIKPDVKVLMLTVFSDDEYQIEAIRNGADGYVLKKEFFEELIPAINLVLPIDQNEKSS